MIGWIRSHAQAAAGVALTIVVLVVAASIILGGDAIKKRSEPTSDTPPAEYFYLDSARVLAYLGQARGGLSASEKRTLSATSGVEATVKGGPLAEVKGSSERQTSIEETVTPDAADRFLTLLSYLRAGRAPRGKGEVKFLQDMDARTRRSSRRELAKPLERLNEGDFLRLRDAHLFLPPFAALVPRAGQAAAYEGGQFLRRQGSNLRTAAGREAKDYLGRLGRDPELPFVVPILDKRGRSLMTFLLPARNSALLDNARLLAGNLTVVGKVVYIERRFPGDPNCEEPTRAPCTYVDHRTALSFGTALQGAPAIRRSLDLGGQAPLEFVKQALTFNGPFVVLLPVAVYQ